MPDPWQPIGLILAFAAGLGASFLLRRRRRGAARLGPRSVLLETLEDPWVIVGGDERIVDLNAAAARSLGVTEIQARGADSIAILAAWPAVQTLKAAAVQKVEATLNGLAYEVTVRPFGQGRIVYLRSIADRRRLEDELRRAQQAAAMADRAKSQFLAMMSHEIRTPLNGVVGFTELLQDTPLDAEQTEFVQLAIQSGRTLLVIIDDILDYSKIEAGQLILESMPIDLTVLMEGTLAGFAPKAAAKGIELSWSIAPGTPAQVRGDPIRIVQVLTNLVGNAVKFTQQGGVKVKLTGRVVSGVSPPVAILSWEVVDTGIGIAPESLERLVRPFSQADVSATRSYGGTGLGLAITRRLCELMGGRLQVVSEPGKGSAFTATVHTPVEAAAVPAPEAAGVVLSDRKLRVLALEDNEINRRLLGTLLLRRGHQVDFAEDGLEGLEALNRAAYDIVFVDLAMPRMDGWEFVRRVRAREAERAEPARHLIALTASVLKGERERCLASGMDDFLSKPLDQPALNLAFGRFFAARAAKDSSTAPAS